MTILIAGHTGLVGSAVFQRLKSLGEDVIGVNSSVVNLLDRQKTFDFVGDLKPDAVINAAAFVGGIVANDTYPVDFLSKNLQIQINLMDASHNAGVNRLVFLGSSCIYPRDCQQPIKEEYLMTGKLEATNSAYAIAKIAGIELVNSYRKQFNRAWISLMPTNIYGPNDNFDLNRSHVLPALINRFVLARRNDQESVTLWGSGVAKREFLHTSDLAKAVVIALEQYDDDLHLNVGTGEDLTIRELANMIAKQVNFDGRIEWDLSRPDGTPRKVLDVSRLKSLGWSPEISLRDGIAETIQWFEANYN